MIYIKKKLFFLLLTDLNCQAIIYISYWKQILTSLILFLSVPSDVPSLVYVRFSISIQELFIDLAICIQFFVIHSPSLRFFLPCILITRLYYGDVQGVRIFRSDLYSSAATLEQPSDSDILFVLMPLISFVLIPPSTASSLVFELCIVGILRLH